MSTYVRQFLERMERPDVDHIEGILPAIAVEQPAGATVLPGAGRTIAAVADQWTSQQRSAGRVDQVQWIHIGHLGSGVGRRTLAQQPNQRIAEGDKCKA